MVSIKETEWPWPEKELILQTQILQFPSNVFSFSFSSLGLIFFKQYCCTRTVNYYSSENYA